MIDVQIDEQEVKTMYLNKIEEKIKEIDAEKLFWDTKELTRRTCMSWGTVLNTFFYEPDFPKFKIGQKWYFPAEETKKFLLSWLEKNGSI
ncbi:group-specific protein [Alkalihalobacillus pseudalcaliphilus]|uniref:group-specific protein n=1 Tax=Alkalihalobacillus pseudalcaliphilus TaxID=79884 RepID=UPI00064DC04E|nr:group-specific protein [Alkalihalobacillus pseudalcaliphilus]KMK77600.1 group-specific protein [Alkalihalobacillus pseudalcaliphilus]